MAKPGRPKKIPSHRKITRWYGLEVPYVERLNQLCAAKGKDETDLVAYIVRTYIDKQYPDIIAEKRIEVIVAKNNKRKEDIEKDNVRVEKLKKIRRW